MEGGDEGVVCIRRDIHPSFVVKVSLFILPIVYGGPWEQGVVTRQEHG